MNLSAEAKKNIRILILPTVFLAVIWTVFGVNWLFDLQLNRFAVEPRTTTGLLGILFFPLLHGSLGHIAGNSVSVFVLLVGVRYFFPSIFLRVFAISYLFPGLLTWFIGRPSLHLGASGMIYALVVFLFISGVIRVNRYLLTLSLLLVFMYGGLFWGLLPIEPEISWEGHLSGAATGFLTAIWFRKIAPTAEIDDPEPEWEEEEENNDETDAYWRIDHDAPKKEHQTIYKINYEYKPNDEDNRTENK